ncbi:hypothetical protein M8J77_003067 [Diaphorina citri]|nr:hypothetical protein M8J77_003067 [Diaphorina citri]
MFHMKFILRLSPARVKITKWPNYSTSVSNEGRKLTQIIYHNSPERPGIVELCMNRPQARNALNATLVEEILTAVEAIRGDEEVRCVLVRSLVKDVFCAGADLKHRLTLNEDQIRSFVSTLRYMTCQLESIPVPVLAVLDGSAFGGGLEMALACDIRVAASNVRMGLVETKLAIIPGAGGTQRLPRIVGIPLAKELIYTGRLVDSTEAKSIGLVTTLTPQNPNQNAAYLASLRIAEDIAHSGPIAVRMAKRAIDGPGRGTQYRDGQITDSPVWDGQGRDTQFGESLGRDIKGFDWQGRDTKGGERKGTENQDRHTQNREFQGRYSGMEWEGICYDRVIRTQDRVEGLKSFLGKYKPVYKGV